MKFISYSWAFGFLFYAAFGSVIFSSILALRPAEQKNPVEWEYTSVQVDKNAYEVHIKARISSGWKLPALELPEESDFKHTAIRFIKNPVARYQGYTEQIMGVMQCIDTYHDEVRDIQRYYEDSVTFVQLVKVEPTKGPIIIRGTIEYSPYANYTVMASQFKAFAILLEKAPYIK